MTVVMTMVRVMVSFPKLQELDSLNAGDLYDLRRSRNLPDWSSQGTFELWADPKHQLCPLQGARAGRFQGKRMWRLSALDDQVRRCNAVHDGRNERV